MVVAELVKMNKPSLKVTVSESDSSSAEESGESENEAEASENEVEASENESEVSENEGEVSENEGEVSENDEAEADIESGDEDSEDENPVSDKEDTLVTNEGWADSVAKILGSSKPKNKKTLVLSRAKKYSETIKKEKDEKPAFEVIGESSEQTVKTEVKTEDDSAEPPVKKLKQEKSSIRVKPNILEKDRERLLSKIATKGVVQLFNAVRNQQKTLERDLDRDDISENKRAKLLKKFDKRAFLDTLMGQTKSVIVDKEAAALKDEVKDEDKPRWGALRDDFMMGAKMKDWDKESVDE